MMTESELMKIVSDTKMKERSILFAKSVLVDKMTVSETARKYNVTRQTVSGAKNRVLRHKEKAHNIPDDWLSVHCRLPSDLAAAVMWFYDYERYRIGVTVTEPPPPPRLERGAVKVLLEILKQQ